MQFGLESSNQPYLETALNSILSHQTYHSTVNSEFDLSSSWQLEQPTLTCKQKDHPSGYGTDFIPDITWRSNHKDNDFQTIMSYFLNSTEVPSCEDPYAQIHGYGDTNQETMNTTSTPRSAPIPKSISGRHVYQETHTPTIFDGWTYENEDKFYTYSNEPEQVQSLRTSSASEMPFYDDQPNLSKPTNTQIVKTEPMAIDTNRMSSKPVKTVPSARFNSQLRKQHQREQDKNRTRTLNVAFCRLRSCLPEIPKDTKLTKIRTLRYAITYIRNLMETIQEADMQARTNVLFPNDIRTQNSIKMVKSDS